MAYEYHLELADSPQHAIDVMNSLDREQWEVFSCSVSEWGAGEVSIFARRPRRSDPRKVGAFPPRDDSTIDIG